MRHVGDTLVWLAMIMLVVAVVYFTPRVARLFASMGTEHGSAWVTGRTMAFQQDDPCDATP
jgi:hypothetical protein